MNPRGGQGLRRFAASNCGIQTRTATPSSGSHRGQHLSQHGIQPDDGIPSRRTIIALVNNNRDDNLGDQYISASLADRLSHHGKLYIYGPRKSYHSAPEYPRSPSMCRLLRASNLARGGASYLVAAPGGWGSVWSRQPQAPDNASYVGKSALRKLLDRIKFRNLAFGFSVSQAEPANPYLTRMQFLGCRDDHSLNVLRQAGYANCGYFPDLAFSRHFGNLGQPEGIALSFRQSVPGLSSNATSLEMTKALVVEIVRHARADPVEFYHQVDEDRFFNHNLAQSLGISMHDLKLALGDFTEYYRSKAAVVSNRLHCLLMGAACGCLPIALVDPKHDKVRALYETVGLGELLVFTDHDPRECARQVSALLADRIRLGWIVHNVFEKQSRIIETELARIFATPQHRRQ